MKRTTSALPQSRVIILRGLTIVVSLLVIGRLFQVSVIDHAKAVQSAKNQYSVKKTLQAKRGKIYLRDLNGGLDFPVALNIDSYSVIADPLLINDPTAFAGALAPTIETPIEEVRDKVSDKKKRYVVLKKKLSKEQADKVEKLNLRGLTLENAPARLYPENNLAAQTIGFVDAEANGKYGIEAFFNEDLKGYDGSLVGEKDAKRRIIATGKTAKPKDGTNIVLTIDHSLQYIVESKLREAIQKYEAEAGSVVVLDVKTGAVLAMANEPSFDLNKYNEVPSEQVKIYGNAAVSNSWEPGSIFKTFTLASGMDMGLFEPETETDLACSVKVDGYEIHNAEDKCYGKANVIKILADSINIGTIWAADKIGNDKLYEYIHNFGFDAKTGIEQQPEASGKVLPLKQWHDVNRATYSFGQGITATPIQMAAAYASIGNKGKLMKPYLVAKRTEADGREIVTQPKEVRQVIKPETAEKTTRLLRAVVTDGHGKKAAVPGYQVAGKTGTAQVVGENGKYEENQHIGSFAGFFPSNDPKFAMVVKLDKPKAVEFAESSAAPTFGEIAKWLLHYAKVPPTEPTP